MAGERYYPGMGIISEEMYLKIQAGDIHPAVTKFDRTTGETIVADVPPPTEALTVREYLKPDVKIKTR